MIFKNIYLFILIFCLSSCGFKGPPSPIFPTSQNQIDDEILLRNKRQQLDHEKQQKELEKQNKPIKKQEDINAAK